MSAQVIGLQSHIWNNNLKSGLLLALYPFVIMGMIWAIAAAIGLFTSQNASWENADSLASATLSQYWPIILTVVCGWFIVSYFFHAKMIRKLSHSHSVTREEEPDLYNLLENLCISVGMKMPQMEIIESHAMNAFASGIDEKSFCITVTRGLLQSLSKDEVEGVLAHELTHIRNRDVRLLIITIIFTGMVGFAAQLVWSQVRYGMMFRSSGGSRNGKGNGVLLLFAILAILWIGYIATLFTRFAISRRREYLADAGAIELTKNPNAMMRALMRIAGKDKIPKLAGDITMMCIENQVPFLGLFATHPPIEKRITALSETTGFPIPDLPQSKPMYASRASQTEDALSPPQETRTNWTTRQRFRHRRDQTNPWH